MAAPLPLSRLRLASAVFDKARLHFMPHTQRALGEDAVVETATLLRRRLAGLPGGGVIGFAALPAALVAIAVASRYDPAIARRAPTMPRWVRTGAGLCFVASSEAVA